MSRWRVSRCGSAQYLRIIYISTCTHGPTPPERVRGHDSIDPLELASVRAWVDATHRPEIAAAVQLGEVEDKPLPDDAMAPWKQARRRRRSWSPMSSRIGRKVVRVKVERQEVVLSEDVPLSGFRVAS